MKERPVLNYISTRGAAPAVPFDEALLQGLAPDGGLYMSETWPKLPADWQSEMKRASFQDFALLAARAFTGASISEDELRSAIRKAYAPFDHPDIAPLRELEPGLFLLELFHGPTLAFKDFAMQVLAHLFEIALQKQNARRTIIVATSGDTGGAAVEAFAGRERINLFVLFPEGRISDAQRRQMTAIEAENIHSIAVGGTFDDCQRILKSLFADAGFRDEVSLGAVNSINWARIMAQCAYYLWALARLRAPAAFAVPTGNFGDIFSGFVARKMGAELGPLAIATNVNDILHRALSTGVYKSETARQTLSPAMDIQIASNFERLLFECLDRDTASLARLMEGFAKTGELVLPEQVLAAMRAVFRSCGVSDEETLAEIRRTFDAHGVLVDPHTAVGLYAARSVLKDVGFPRVVIATAHPAKFAGTVQSATGKTLEVPPALAARLTAPERFDRLPPDEAAIMSYVRARI